MSPKNMEISKRRFSFNQISPELGTRQADNMTNFHSWAQRKLSLLSPLNILLTISGPLLS